MQESSIVHAGLLMSQPGTLASSASSRSSFFSWMMSEQPVTPPSSLVKRWYVSPSLMTVESMREAPKSCQILGLLNVRKSRVVAYSIFWYVLPVWLVSLSAYSFEAQNTTYEPSSSDQ